MFRAASIVLLATVLCGCAHYGWSSHDTSVSVRTVAVRGDSGLDPSELTRRLVSRLQSEGFDARWDDEFELAYECSVTIVEQGASANGWSPTAEALCDDGAGIVTGRGRSSATLSDASSHDIRGIQQEAALNAIDAAATKLAQSIESRTN